MRARDIMTTPVITVAPETPIKEVAELLIARRIGAAPVIESGDLLVGIVSEADLVSLEAAPEPQHRILVVPRREGPLPQTAGEVMTRHVLTVAQDADVSEIAQLMVEHHVKTVPVVDGDRVVGLVARRDILRVLARSDEEIQAELQELLDQEAAIVGRFHVEVERGTVLLRGTADRTGRRLAELLARSAPGVLDVQFVEVNP